MKPCPLSKIPLGLHLENKGMEQFIVSARKYRPATFDSVVGQASITTTLKNAIRNNHIAQAYLFTGTRGVGKTTCARILAKTINCQNISAAVEPCNECESCKSFNEQRSYSIHELDAASNNSVEDIRLLIEKVRIPPQIGKFSIYIIDEVHMLSAAAFNAFLKTLEEPPKHAIFILATTEKHKILPTILSRCQIFDFNRITVEDTSKFLASIAEKENIVYEPDALNIIAQKADGGMRDALSIFDQVVSFSDNQITYKKVIENLNVLDYDYYFRLVQYFLDSNVRESLLIFDEILSDGFDAHNFLLGLAKHLRDVLVCQDKITIQLLEVGAKLKERYLQQASVCRDTFIFEALNILNQCDIHFKSARNQRLHVELCLVQLCRINAKSVATQAPPVVNTPAKEQPTTPTTAAAPMPPPVQAAAAKPATIQSTPSPVSERPVEKPSSPAPGRTSSSFSLKNAMKTTNPPTSPPAKAEEETPTSESEEDPEQEGIFDPEKVFSAYSNFIETIKSANPRMYSTLQQTPVLGKDTIMLLMSNLAQAEEFNKSIKPELVSYLKKNGGISQFTVNTEIGEQKEQKKLYTAQDKFKYLLTKNPELAKLQQRMNLDFE